MSRMTVGCVPLVKCLVSDHRTLFHIGVRMEEEEGQGKRMEKRRECRSLLDG